MTKATYLAYSQKKSSFCHNFERHVRMFIEEHRLMAKEKKLLISVSGGVDSLVLAEVLHNLNYPIELLHFNHGTRPSENSREEKLVCEFAKKRSLICHVIQLKMNLSEKNFEKKARIKRQKFYRDFIAKNYWVYTAHHIDDSFEWSLMQSFKQSSVKSALGIPVFNKGIVRPFMCVTKKHIMQYAQKRKLKWLEDSSNQNDKFERNFLRLHVTKSIFKKYPKALAHYVSRSNQLAFMHNLHTHSSESKALVQLESSGGILMVSKNFSEHKEEIKKCIYRLSEKSRGEIDHELDKLIKASDEILKDPKSFPFKGPMNFSGGVTIFLMRDHLFISNQKQLEFYREFDHRLKNYLQEKTQIPFSGMMFEFPHLSVNFRRKLNKSSKFIHPLLPVTCLWLKNHSISYSFTPVMSEIDRQLLANDAVILDSSVMGL
jgi:tRNA(Ile)-lysidine synthase